MILECYPHLDFQTLINLVSKVRENRVVMEEETRERILEHIEDMDIDERVAEAIVDGKDEFDIVKHGTYDMNLPLHKQSDYRNVYLTILLGELHKLGGFDSNGKPLLNCAVSIMQTSDRGEDDDYPYAQCDIEGRKLVVACTGLNRVAKAIQTMEKTAKTTYSKDTSISPPQ